jgi:hypothetical protein
MLNDLIPNISRHYLCSLLQLDQISGMKIVETVSNLPPDEIEEFLISLGNTLAKYFFDLDECLEDYNKMRIQAIKNLENLQLEEDLEEMT